MRPLSIMKFKIIIFSLMTFKIMTFSIMTFSIMTSFITFSKKTLSPRIKRFTQDLAFSVTIMGVVMPNVVAPSGISSRFNTTL
jgi:hypothetical protein